MGKGKRNSLLALFGLKKSHAEESWSGEYRYRYQYPTKVRPSDEDRPQWYGEPDIDRKARDYIDRFHRGINSQD
ncbi:hypothetical protein LUZ62_016648 [Rhynchospora pubera]|uniref:Uncharacterized protein n=1 Tax=Rhynchospora pubera TaxID=906938 RepID=A0AAV8E8B0_9POAL|nr:hypothetical protein LUZ62_059314 [Rhynchospora pubera]KAJ4776804.1 hypothetical protein LUZ62_061061 [Rhynchospora pubera]KAJ4783599.1 hypothetical protein LUZ62_034845 [Rhynchospora pubera]KAJ4804082.1 hypothetical protein LUZ62_016648 [Rhynchospora pubera]